MIEPPITTIECLSSDHIPIVSVSGEIDVSNIHKLVSTVEHALERQPKALILSLRGVHYLDSTTFNKLAAWSKVAPIFLVKPQLPAVASLFDLLKFNQILTLVDSIEEGMSAARVR